MRHIWPLDEKNPVFNDAFDIAIQYLEQTGQALNYVYVSQLVASSITAALESGVKHKIALANAASVAVQSEMEAGDPLIQFPRAS